MRADTHAGPEQKTLHTQAGYIDARPQSANLDIPSCDARSVHTLGHLRTSEQARGTSAVEVITDGISSKADVIETTSGVWGKADVGARGVLLPDSAGSSHLS